MGERLGERVYITKGEKMSEKAETMLKKRMEKRKRKRKAKGMVFLAFLFFIGVLTFALYSPIFIIQSFEVQGLNKLKQEEVIIASGIQTGLNIFKFSAIRAKKEIKKIPYVKEVIIKRKLSDTVQIFVKERIPVAAVMYLGSYILIDEEGIALEANPDITGKNLIEIKGLQMNKYVLGQPITEKSIEGLNAALDILTLLKKNDLLLRIGYIDVKNPNKIMLYLDKRISVNVGDKSIFNETGEFRYRLEVLRSILQSGTISEGEYIDLTRERPTSRPDIKEGNK